jgi:hypothetical protein
VITLITAQSDPSPSICWEHGNAGVVLFLTITALQYPSPVGKTNVSTDTLVLSRPFWKLDCSRELQACMRAVQVLTEHTPKRFHSLPFFGTRECVNVALEAHDSRRLHA